AGGGQGYVSPIPIQNAHLGHALASEWTKIKSVRSTIWTLGVMVVLVLGLGLLIAMILSGTDTDLVDAPLLSFGFFGVLAGSICVITLGVLVVASEYGTGMIRTTLTACPSRARVLTAKAIVFFLVAFVITTVTTTLIAVVHASMLSGMGGKDPSGAEWFRATVGVGLYVAMLGLLSLSVGALVRHSAGAITIMLGVLLLPMVVALFLMKFPDVSQALFEYSIPNSLGVFYSTPATEGSSGPSGWEPLWILTGVTALTMAGAYTALAKRDV
ncbi:ABC transporter permease, partial [Streptomyces sp. URMC 123]|uniref:ABC transporter permease n=1 Tax=Streptomyces sp. URMC 123 TaxID=3423403 RepID=UPI003F1E31EB